jgi:outer membrane protein OmpA-like peptidoglycan-associated protein
VKVQTFFQEPCNVRYFVVQEEEAQEEQHQQQSNEQQESEQQSNYKQRLALFSSSLEALKHKDSKAIDCIAEETSAKNCTSWFKQM